MIHYRKSIPSSEVVFLRRLSDGRYYRGAIFWRWCRSWRHASALTVRFWHTWVLWKIKDDTEFVTLTDAVEGVHP